MRVYRIFTMIGVAGLTLCLIAGAHAAAQKGVIEPTDTPRIPPATARRTGTPMPGGEGPGMGRTYRQNPGRPGLGYPFYPGGKAFDEPFGHPGPRDYGTLGSAGQAPNSTTQGPPVPGLGNPAHAPRIPPGNGAAATRRPSGYALPYRGYGYRHRGRGFGPRGPGIGYDPRGARSGYGYGYPGYRGLGGSGYPQHRQFGQPPIAPAPPQTRRVPVRPIAPPRN